jgi:hypothetical protein
MYGGEKKNAIREILPRSGLVYSEKLVFLLFGIAFLIVLLFFDGRGGLAEILCKPKIMPLKSAVLEQLQKIERASEILNDGIQEEAERES